MYINKMIFMERGDVDSEVMNFLDEHVIMTTDYGMNEITMDTWQNFVNDIDNYDLQGLTLQQIKEGIGTDVAEMLEKDKLDFVMFI